MSEEPKELSPVRHIFDLREFLWPEFSAAVLSTGGTTHPYTDAPGRWCDSKGMVGAADFRGSGTECSVYGVVPDAFLLAVYKYTTLKLMPDDAELNLVFPTNVGTWLPDGSYLSSGPWSVRKFDNKKWRLHCTMAGICKYDDDRSLAAARKTVVQSMLEGLGVSMRRVDEECAEAERKLEELRERRVALAVAQSACVNLANGHDAAVTYAPQEGDYPD